MKKLNFIIFIILIISQISLFAVVKSSASLVLNGIVQPRVVMSVSEQLDTRSINSITGNENLQVFVFKDSGNVTSGYQIVVESQNAVMNQTDSNNQNYLEITKISQESISAEGSYKDTLMVKVIAI
ncbi:MAG: hypothetical protein HQ557_03645 [Bacteroidetes bacterium]|nr:hypothetical protein [Bacteroidota bacterium]